jgi:hypothetical protein
VGFPGFCATQVIKHFVFWQSCFLSNKIVHFKQLGQIAVGQCAPEPTISSPRPERGCRGLWARSPPKLCQDRAAVVPPCPVSIQSHTPSILGRAGWRLAHHLAGWPSARLLSRLWFPPPSLRNGYSVFLWLTRQGGRRAEC